MFFPVHIGVLFCTLYQCISVYISIYHMHINFHIRCWYTWYTCFLLGFISHISHLRRIVIYITAYHDISETCDMRDIYHNAVTCWYGCVQKKTPYICWTTTNVIWEMICSDILWYVCDIFFVCICSDTQDGTWYNTIWGDMKWYQATVRKVRYGVRYIMNKMIWCVIWQHKRKGACSVRSPLILQGWVVCLPIWILSQ